MSKKKNRTPQIVPSKDGLLTKEMVRNWILYSEAAVKRAAIVIYDQQTAEEQTHGLSLEENNKGFNKVDARELSEFAVRCKTNKPITVKQMNDARYKLLKYAQQIADITNAKKNIQMEFKI